MAFLNVDTDLLRSSVSVAERTNDAISEAATLLNQVVVHNDWVCSERNQINSYTLENRETAQKIEGYASSFYNAVKNASARFDAAEQEMRQRTNTVDDPISRIISVVPGNMTDVTIHTSSSGHDYVCMSSFGNLMNATESSSKEK